MRFRAWKGQKIIVLKPHESIMELHFALDPGVLSLDFLFLLFHGRQNK